MFQVNFFSWFQNFHKTGISICCTRVDYLKKWDKYYWPEFLATSPMQFKMATIMTDAQNQCAARSDVFNKSTATDNGHKNLHTCACRPNPHSPFIKISQIYSSQLSLMSSPSLPFYSYPPLAFSHIMPSPFGVFHANCVRLFWRPSLVFVGTGSQGSCALVSNL